MKEAVLIHWVVSTKPLDLVEELMERLAVVPGRKNVVWT
jgi:hypothetical protein